MDTFIRSRNPFIPFVIPTDIVNENLIFFDLMTINTHKAIFSKC